MRLKFTFHSPGGGPTDLIAEFDGSVTVGQLAHHLATADPRTPAERGVGDWTLSTSGPDGRILVPDDLLVEAGVSSGASITLARAAPVAPGSASAVATITIVAGPEAGSTFHLAPGTSLVGRGRECAVRLADSLASRRHARIHVGARCDVIDLGSANGIQINGEAVPRARLEPGQRVTIGDTVLELTRLGQATRPDEQHGFVRPARVVREYDGREFQAPAPPEKRRPQHFPLIPLLAPLIMGLVLYKITGRWESLLFIALTPMMLIGNAAESFVSTRREFKRAVIEFRSNLDGLREAVLEEFTVEVSARLAEHPSVADCASAVETRGDVLWSRHADLPRYGELRLGLGRSPSRCVIDLPTRSSAPYALVREVEETAAELREVDGVPIVARLGEMALGVVGTRVGQLAAARSIVVQLAALHSPAELAMAFMLGGRAAADWEWVKWLPHTAHPSSPLSVRHAVASPADVATLASALEELIGQRREEDDPSAVKVAVVIDSSEQVEHHRLVRIAERGPAVGVYVVWLSASRTTLPACCRTFVETDGDGAVGYVVDGDLVRPVAVERVDLTTAQAVSLALAPIEDVGAPVADDSDIPRMISQFATLQDLTLGSRAESIVERWQASHSLLTGPYAPEEPAKRPGTLRALVGMSADGAHTLDLRTDGPHALVGGTTNSGKSELLQAWILALAATHSPERVTFLLVDYKGGSAFADCTQLPHTIGLVTDLSQHMVRRALTSLGAELKYREELLHRYGAKDLIELEKHGVRGAPPSLIIVVDEFAALVHEVPEFVDGVVNVAQRGRSLGLHLILATQQPSGVIRGSLRANTNLRIALRMADEADSTDVVGSADAAHFDPAIPGRAMSRSGPKRLVAFQGAYAGGWTSDTPEPPSLHVEELNLTSPVLWEAPPEGEVVPKDRNATDIKRLVSTIRNAHELALLPQPRKVWLPTLPTEVDLSTLATQRRDDELVFALGDDPERQSQPAVTFRPDREGNMAVYGTGGTGKSGLLRAIAIAAGFSQRGGPCHVYGLDFGSRALQMLEVLPHVGSIIPGSDAERVARLIGWLRTTVDERAARYAAVNAGSIRDYRARVDPSEVRLIVLVDNVGAFRAMNEGVDRSRYIDMLTSVAAEGRPVGIHLVFAAGERTAIHTALSSAIQRRLVMRLANEDDYSMLGVPLDILDAHTPSGRAIDGEREIQVGILGTDRDDASQASRLAALAEALRAAGVVPAPQIQRLASDVALASVPDPAEDVTLGIASASLAPIGVRAAGGFLVTGPPAGGRTTALRTLITSARQRLPGIEMHYVGPRRSTLRDLPWWTSSSSSVEEIGARAQELTERVTHRTASSPRLMVVVESAGDLVMSPAENALQGLVKACIAEEQWFVAEGEASTVRTISGFLGLVKSSRRGLVVQPDQEMGSALFNTPFPRINRADFPQGRGFLVGAGRAELVQVARPD